MMHNYERAVRGCLSRSVLPVALIRKYSKYIVDKTMHLMQKNSTHHSR